ncbi:MAG: SMI1/KNR4 family protein [Bacteroidetes bacterium]|nr:SMI1/KNR4 family protein [Bacteroidota bacterium]
MLGWLFGKKKSAKRRRRGNREERDKRVRKGIEQIEALFAKEIPPSYKEFLQNYNQVHYLDRTCDVYSNADTQDRVLYTFVIKKFLGINPAGSEDILKNYSNYKGLLPRPELMPIAFDQFRNIMCLDMADGSVHFWDIQNSVDARSLSVYMQTSRVFFVAPTFLDFKDRLYKVSKYT